MSSLDANPATRSQCAVIFHGVGGTQFSLKCRCGENGPGELQEALAEGWRNIENNENGAPEEFVGYCPMCR